MMARIAARFAPCWATVAVLCVGCASEAPPELVTLRDPFTRSGAYPLALVEGRLSVQRGCLVVVTTLPDGRMHSTALAFPAGYRLQKHRDRLQVIDTHGRVRGQVGDSLSGGGGEFGGSGSPIGWAAKRVGPEAVARCGDTLFAINPTQEEILAARP